MTSAPEHALPSRAARRQFTWQSPDGLTLAGCEWSPQQGGATRTASAIPVLCLPGLSRNTRDFHDVAAYLQSAGHHVVALDYRGRGRSDWDPDWRNYTLAVEAADIDAAIAHLDLQRFAVLGTSRGGLHALAMADRYPADRMAAVILNDIGPQVEMEGLRRIAGTLGQQMTYGSREDLAAILRQFLGPQFPAFGMEDWLKLAGQLASEEDGRFVMDYDPALANQLAGLDDAAPLPDLWHLYES
ncbi:alpha/beta fold hydrolase [Roseibium salinum]|uniref:alpha/beta fold hydrolase n=1 Tax=Roseibium salinum TaxID=1604349 RepID=UPI00361B04E2